MSQVGAMAIEMIGPSIRCVAMSRVRPMAIGMIGPSNRCGHEPGPTNGHRNDVIGSPNILGNGHWDGWPNH
jgi:hypothetical protein